MEIVTESETCRVYKTVLQTIKVAARNLTEATNFLQHNTINTGRMAITP
jgi:hypothetical protein